MNVPAKLIDETTVANMKAELWYYGLWAEGILAGFALVLFYAAVSSDSFSGALYVLAPWGRFASCVSIALSVLSMALGVMKLVWGESSTDLYFNSFIAIFRILALCGAIVLFPLTTEVQQLYESSGTWTEVTPGSTPSAVSGCEAICATTKTTELAGCCKYDSSKCYYLAGGSGPLASESTAEMKCSPATTAWTQPTAGIYLWDHTIANESELTDSNWNLWKSGAITMFVGAVTSWVLDVTHTGVWRSTEET